MTNPTRSELEDQRRELNSLILRAKAELRDATKEENSKWKKNAQGVIAERTRQLEGVQSLLNILNAGGDLPPYNGPMFGNYANPRYGF
jgi:hypothetical protein